MSPHRFRSHRTLSAPGAQMASGALLAALACGALPGCAAVAAGGIGVILSQEFQQGAQVVHYAYDADYVWARVKETLAHLSARRPDFDEVEMTAAATVDGGSVQIAVISIEPGVCRMAVKGRKYGLQNNALAETVLARIHREIEP